jgi:hypothetical protein
MINSISIRKKVSIPMTVNFTDSIAYIITNLKTA